MGDGGRKLGLSRRQIKRLSHGSFYDLQIVILTRTHRREQDHVADAGLPVNSITIQSIPIPRPAVGGRPSPAPSVVFVEEHRFAVVAAFAST